MGVIGSAKLLQALARDTLIPGLSMFGQGTKKSDEPTKAILLTFAVAQITMLFDINRIASFITMTYLMTFLVTNLACFLLKVGSAPNFRPSFHYFNSWTALAGTLISGATMFFVDGIYASASVCILVIIFLLIHYTTPPKPWGDVSQSLIYHQVRKYLLRLRPEHVKFWRPQILLFVSDFESQYRMIHFCNSLKKGALFVLGRVIVTEDFAGAVPEFRREQASWAKFIEFSRVKAFVNITVSPTTEWGIRNIVLNSGLGGMRPNIVILDQFREDTPLADTFQGLRQRRNSRLSKVSSNEGASHKAPENPGKNSKMSVQGYLTVLEDLLFNLRINVAVARGFDHLQLPSEGGYNTKKYIDLWPIQMSAEIAADGSTTKQNLLTTNFDTYTLILQLGCILNTVPSWKQSYCLRVAVFVEYETDVGEERGRVETLLEKLRIEAEVLVFCLANGDLKTYQIIVNGEVSGVNQEEVDSIEAVLKDEEWWQDMRKFRDGYQGARAKGKLGHVAKLLGSAPAWPSSSFQYGRRGDGGQRFDALRKFMESNRRKSVGSIGGIGVNLGMQTHHLLDSLVDYPSEESDSSSSEESSINPYMSDEEDGPDNEAIKPVAEMPRGKANPSTPKRSREQRRPGAPGIAQLATSIPESAVAGSSSESDIEEDSVRPPAPAITTTDESGPVEGSSSGKFPQRPQLPRSTSSNRFSSSPIPETRVATEEGAGPSIMFAPTSTDKQPGTQESIYSHPRTTEGPATSEATSRGNQASGYPSQASVPLSFNDLPCRAQHLILNELMKSHSQNTAVLFTTLPSPVEGTWTDELTSKSYVSDLEVLCDDLPPCLLIHSNSMTVTMNL